MIAQLNSGTLSDKKGEDMDKDKILYQFEVLMSDLKVNDYQKYLRLKMKLLEIFEDIHKKEAEDI